MIYTVGGNTSAGSTLVANGGGVAKKSYANTYSRIAHIWRPKYKKGEAIKVAQEALKYIGYLEKKSDTNLESFTANAGYNNYNMFAPHARAETGSSVYVNGVAWCDIFVDDMFIRALGVKRAKALLGGWSAYTPASSDYMRKAGAEEIKDHSKAQYGDVVFFKNSSRICHVEICVTGAGDTLVPDTAYDKGDFIRDVHKILGTSSAAQALKKTVTLSRTKNAKNELVLPVQKYLKVLGYYAGVCDRDFGIQTEAAVRKYQKEIVKASIRNQDGIITAKAETWKKMLGAS